MVAASARWLRERFALGSSEAAEAGDAGVEPDTKLISAAVLIPLVERDSGLTVLLTQRTAHLRDHAGQISFPGGRSEPGDETPIMTALREAREEVGIAAEQVEVLGVLRQYRTGTGFAVVPVVALVRPPLNLKLDDFEVADAFEIPFDFLVNPRHHQRHCLEAGGASREYWAIPWQEYYIWGATAGMLVSLSRFIGAREDLR